MIDIIAYLLQTQHLILADSAGNNIFNAHTAIKISISTPMSLDLIR